MKRAKDLTEQDCNELIAAHLIHFKARPPTGVEPSPATDAILAHEVLMVLAQRHPEFDYSLHFVRPAQVIQEGGNEYMNRDYWFFDTVESGGHCCDSWTRAMAPTFPLVVCRGALVVMGLAD